MDRAQLGQVEKGDMYVQETASCHPYELLDVTSTIMIFVLM